MRRRLATIVTVACFSSSLVPQAATAAWAFQARPAADSLACPAIQLAQGVPRERDLGQSIPEGGGWCCGIVEPSPLRRGVAGVVARPGGRVLGPTRKGRSTQRSWRNHRRAVDMIDGVAVVVALCAGTTVSRGTRRIRYRLGDDAGWSALRLLIGWGFLGVVRKRAIGVAFTPAKAPVALRS